MRYDILVDGERRARVKTADEVRDWIARYRTEEQNRDPHVVHVQVLERGRLAFLTGGKLVDLDRFRTG